MNRNILANIQVPQHVQAPAVRGVNCGQISELYMNAREASPVVRRCRESSAVGTIKGIRDVDGCDMLENDMVDRVAECGLALSNCSSHINLSSCRNVIRCNAVLTSNIKNDTEALATSKLISKECNLQLWTASREQMGQLARRVRMGEIKKEDVAYSNEICVTGYKDHPDISSLAKSLKISKNDFQNLSVEMRNRIANKMAVSRGPMSRFTRLVIAFMYYIALETRGSGDIANADWAIENNDEVLSYNSFNLNRACEATDAAYIHCDMPNDKDYINFLLLIAKEYPFRKGNSINGLLERVPMGTKRVEAFIGSTLQIPKEAQRVIVMCTSRPAAIGGSSRVQYTSKQWYSYIVNYARSIHREGDLDQAYSVAALLCFHKYLPNVSLPSRKSQGEIFTQSLASKNQEDEVPNSFQVKELLLGSFCLAHSVAYVAKDIISNHKVATGTNPGHRDMYSEFVKHPGSRDRWYRYMASIGGGDGVHVVRIVDALRMEDRSVGMRIISNINPLTSWLISPLDNRKLIENGFSDLYRSFKLFSENKMALCRPDEKKKTDSALRVLGACNGNLSKARNTAKSVRYASSAMRMINMCIHDGDVCLTRGGISCVRSSTWYVDKRGDELMDPEPEHPGEDTGSDQGSMYEYDDQENHDFDDDTVDRYEEDGDMFSTFTPKYRVPKKKKEKKVMEIKHVDLHNQNLYGDLRSMLSTNAMPRSVPAYNYAHGAESDVDIERMSSSVNVLSLIKPLPKPGSPKSDDEVSVMDSRVISLVEQGTPRQMSVVTSDDIASNVSVVSTPQFTKAGSEGSGGGASECKSEYPTTPPRSVDDTSQVGDFSTPVKSEEIVTNDNVKVNWEDVSDDEDDEWYYNVGKFMPSIGSAPSVTISSGPSLVEVSEEEAESVKDTDPLTIIDDREKKRKRGEMMQIHRRGIAQKCFADLRKYTEKYFRMEENDNNKAEELNKLIGQAIVGDILITADPLLVYNLSEKIEDRIVLQIEVLCRVAEEYSKTDAKLRSNTRASVAKVTKEFRKAINEEYEISSMSETPDLPKIAYMVYRTRGFDSEKSETMVKVDNKMPIAHCGLGIHEVCSACAGVMGEFLLAASYDHAWYVAMSKKCGVRPYVLKVLLSTKSFRLIAMYGVMFPGASSSNTKITGAAIRMYADTLIMFGYKKKSEYYESSIGRKVSAYLPDMTTDMLKSWFFNRVDIRPGRMSLESMRLEITKTAQRFNSYQYEGERRDYERF